MIPPVMVTELPRGILELPGTKVLRQDRGLWPEHRKGEGGVHQLPRHNRRVHSTGDGG